MKHPKNIGTAYSSMITTYIMRDLGGIKWNGRCRISKTYFQDALLLRGHNPILWNYKIAFIKTVKIISKVYISV